MEKSAILSDNCLYRSDRQVFGVIDGLEETCMSQEATLDQLQPRNERVQNRWES